MSIPLRNIFLVTMILALCTVGCMHKDPVVEKEIQARYSQQDAAFAGRNIAGVAAFCTSDYSETNAGLISERPKNANIAIRGGRARVQKERVRIPSLGAYKEYLAIHFASVQSLSVQSTIATARVNEKKDRASVSVHRETRASVLPPGSQQPFPLVLQETYDDSWIKDPAKGWLKQSSSVSSTNTQRDRMAESES